ncbi:MAG TPA: hypothetical protein VKU40_08405 [Thermoanaerobaculia bacterium]|nr:hypothetical protein [Thermoanaerobaculia bacterium]
MRAFRKYARHLTLPTALLLAALTSVSAAAEAATDGVRLRGEAVVVAGEAVALPLAAGERLTATTGSTDGWFAAGVQTAIDHGAERARLTLWQGDDTAADALPVPATHGRFLASPSLLAADGAPLGFAWLEGSDRERAAVRWATWNGAGWNAAETLSPTGPGAQLGLAAARLDDGRVLLAWSRFDGEDDEIYWSLGGVDGFSAPARLEADDRVPDHTPAVAAVAGGALAAWTAFDAASRQYRVMSARFDGNAWSAPEALGPVGSLYPSFEASPADGGALVLYRRATPRGWEVVETDAAGRSLRRANAEASAPERPAASLADGAPLLLFADRREPLDWQDLALTPAEVSP